MWSKAVHFLVGLFFNSDHKAAAIPDIKAVYKKQNPYYVSHALTWNSRI